MTCAIDQAPRKMRAGSLRCGPRCARVGSEASAGVERRPSLRGPRYLGTAIPSVTPPGPGRRSTPALASPPSGEAGAGYISIVDIYPALPASRARGSRPLASSLDPRQMISTDRLAQTSNPASPRVPSRPGFPSLPPGAAAPSSLVPRLLRFASPLRVTGRRPAGGPGKPGADRRSPPRTGD